MNSTFPAPPLRAVCPPAVSRCPPPANTAPTRRGTPAPRRQRRGSRWPTGTNAEPEGVCVGGVSWVFWALGGPWDGQQKPDSAPTALMALQPEVGHDCPLRPQIPIVFAGKKSEMLSEG